MTVEMRRDLSPVDYIRLMFAETKDQKLSIPYEPFLDAPYTITYEMDWTEEDFRVLTQRCTALLAALANIAKLHDVLEEASNREQWLTEEEQAVWNTYIRPFDPFEVDLSVVTELQFRSETETLSEEEQELLERHYEWYAANCLQRLPEGRCSPVGLINRAKRYHRLLVLDAPQVVLKEEGRCLAEEMVLYYHSVQKP